VSSEVLADLGLKADFFVEGHINAETRRARRTQRGASAGMADDGPCRD
jgi:hypothetical protein